jgi:hypothetical protein
MSRLALLVFVLGAFRAQAQDAGVDLAPTPGTSSLLDELDAAAAAPVAAPAPAVEPNPLLRAIQSFNPDLSVIVDGVAGYSERAPLRLAGDDPDLGGDATHPAAGFGVQELELGFQAVVDPYFRADVFLTIPNLKGLEVEEAAITTTSLPLDLQVKAGIFRSALGRQNAQHLHAQSFTFRPLLNAAYLATDGLRAPGLQVSWLAPAPFFLQLNLEAFSVAPPEDLALPTTFGGGRRTDLTWAAELKTFAAATEQLSIAAGLDFATGLSPGLDGHPELEGARSLLFGANLYLKYKPANETGGWFSLAWTTEYFARKLGVFLDAGLYSQLVAQLSRRWSLGVREDVLGLPASELQPLTSKTSLSVGFTASEFARLRAQVEREFTHGAAVPDAWGAWLVLEVTIGAHGAHAF